MFQGLLRAARVTIFPPTADPQFDAPYDEPLVKDVRYLGSYDLLKHDLIIVPGSPRIWTPPDVPFTLRSGHPEAREGHGIDPTDLRLEMLFTAVDVMHTPISWPDVDIVSSRQALRYLFDWADGKYKKGFRIDLQPLGARTVLLAEVREDWSGRDPGYGLVFEVKTTQPMHGTEGSLEHSRIVQYNLLGLNVVLRYEADARIAPVHESPSPLASTPVPQIALSPHGPRYIRAGEIVEQEDIVEIKSAKGSGGYTYPKNKIIDATPQLILSATQRLHTGLHADGKFYKLEEHACDEQTLLTSRPRAVPSMRKLQRVLSQVKDAVREGGVHRRLSIVHLAKASTLGFHERTATARDPLPPVFQNRFVRA